VGDATGNVAFPGRTGDRRAGRRDVVELLRLSAADEPDTTVIAPVGSRAATRRCRPGWRRDVRGRNGNLCPLETLAS